MRVLPLRPASPCPASGLRRWRLACVFVLAGSVCLAALPALAQDWTVVDTPGAGDQSKAADDHE